MARSRAQTIATCMGIVVEWSSTTVLYTRGCAPLQAPVQMHLPVGTNPRPHTAGARGFLHGHAHPGDMHGAKEHVP